MKTVSNQENFKIDINWPSLPNSIEAIQLLEEQILPSYLLKCRWFGGKSQTISKVNIEQIITFPCDSKLVYILILKVLYQQGNTELYNFPIAYCSAQEFGQLAKTFQNAVVFELKNNMLIFDAVYCGFFREAIFKSIISESLLATGEIKINFSKSASFKPQSIPFTSKVLATEQSNSAIIFNDQYFFKLFRKVAYGINPDFEMIRFLSEETEFKNLPVYKGSMDLTDINGNILLGMMQDLCENQGDAWTLMQAEVESYYNKIAEVNWNNTKQGQKLQFEKVPETLNQLIGIPLFDKISLLAKRTAQMHKALASNQYLNDFKPQMFDDKCRVEFYHNVATLIDEKLLLLNNNLHLLTEEVKMSALLLIQKKEEIKAFFKKILSENTSSKIIRIHGDYHLGQVLYTGSDFIILDFEGEPDKSLGQRRLKYSPLKDVAGMLRSFSYAAYAVLYNQYQNDKSLQTQLEPWAKEWYNYVGRIFLDVYFDEIKDADILESMDDLLPLMQVFLFEKAIYELGYELNNRTAWVNIPMTGVMQFVNNYLND